MQHELSHQEVISMLPRRPVGGHKGSFGHLLVVAGARGFTGAVKLTCDAANRAGVGLVTAGIPASLSDVLSASLLEPMTLALPATDSDSLAYDALDGILSAAAGKTALAAGPGVSRHPDTARLLRALFARRPLPMVMDADGLNALADAPARIEGATRGADSPEVVFTPHPGEMSRLTGMGVADIQNNRAIVALQYARVWGVVVALKGQGTLIAAPDGRVRRCPTGNHGMATGGSGDVLTGVIGALLAQGVRAFEAACIGVYVHGLAGDIAVGRGNARALVAGDIIAALPRAWRALEGCGR